MNKYELIAESVWNTYSNMAHLIAEKGIIRKLVGRLKKQVVDPAWDRFYTRADQKHQEGGVGPGHPSFPLKDKLAINRARAARLKANKEKKASDAAKFKEIEAQRRSERR